MGDIIASYDIVGAFWMTIRLAALSAVGALVIGTIVAIMRVSPINVLRAMGATYVNLVRNTPLTLILIFCVLGALYILGVQIVPSDQLTTRVFWWAVTGLSIYHAAFVCEALRSGVNTVPLGQAEAARSIGLTFGQSLRTVILPQAFRGSIAPLGSVLIALIKNTTVAAAAGVAEAAYVMNEVIENETGTTTVFLIFAIGFVILTLPVGIAATYLSRRWAVQR